MKVHFLGTNGWFNSSTGETPCVLIEAAEGYIICDAGNGLRKIDRIITDSSKPIALFLSHFHLDHTFGLHLLPKFHFPQGIAIYGQPGTKDHLRALLASPWTAPMDKLQMKVAIHECNEGDHQLPVLFTCRFLVHSDPCLGYRFALEGKTVTYCTDTGVCDGLRSLANRADLLITECSWRRPNQNPQWPHLAPEDAATVARDAKIGQLALIHFDANTYTTANDRSDAQCRAQAIFPASRAMPDDSVIQL
ncbi:MAG: ribonuclease Z [Deltaproteobacteria bacterium]|nr:ribonuclease Z [Deltaproteobacteria bacterium]